MICIHESPSKYVAKYGQILAANAIPYEMVNCQDEDFWQNMQNASQYIYYLGMGSPELLRHHNLISVLDKVLKIPCFPNWETSWHYDDKIAETFLLQSRAIPWPKAGSFGIRAKLISGCPGLLPAGFQAEERRLLDKRGQGVRL